MRNFSLIILLSSVLAACSTGSNKEQEANIELVRNYINAVEKLDYEAMGNYLADNYMGLGPSFGDTIYRKEAIENWKANVEGLYAKIEHTRMQLAPVTIQEGPSKGNWVSCWAELRITYKHNQQTVTIWANSDYMVENGKITRTITLYNEADALRQLGYTIIPPGQ